MSSVVDLLADLSKLPPAAIVGILALLGLLLAAVTIVTGVKSLFRYLEKRIELKKQQGQDQLIQTFMLLDGHKEPDGDKFVHAIRGNMIAEAKTASSGPEEQLVDPELAQLVGGALRLVRGSPAPPSSS